MTTCTATLSGNSFQHGECIINLIDTPGFNDTTKSDTDTLQEVSTWLSLTYRADVKLTGIIYLHRISDNRMSGPAFKNLEMFRLLCGDRALPNVVLATTRWSNPMHKQEYQEQQERQAELISRPEYWGDLIRQGATSALYDGTYSSALSIISILETCSPLVLDIQRQMVDDGYPLLQTAAGRCLDGDFQKTKADLQHQLDEVQTQVMTARQQEVNKIFAEDMEKQRAEIMSRLALAEQERRKLDVDIAKKSRESDKRIQELAQQTQASKWGALVAGAAKGLGLLGPAVMALMGVPMSGAVTAFTLSLKVSEFIFQMVDRIRSMFS